MSGLALARAAQALEGTPFRLHGRDESNGLDCIGVLTAALAAIGRRIQIPTGYTLKLHNLDVWLPDPITNGFAIATGAPITGDVLLLNLRACQHHLVIAAEGGRFVHAHAGLRRVVIGYGPLPGPISHHWRLLTTD